MWEVIATHGIFSKQKTNTEHEPFAPNRGNPDAVFNTSMERNKQSNCTASISANALVGAAVRIKCDAYAADRLESKDFSSPLAGRHQQQARYTSQLDREYSTNKQTF